MRELFEQVENLPKAERWRLVSHILHSFITLFTSLPFDDNASEHYAIVRAYLTTQGKPIGANDLMIASIALAKGLILVTHNIREFERVPRLLLEDWETPKTD